MKNTSETLFHPLSADVRERLDTEFRKETQTMLPADLLVFLLTAAHPNAESLNYSGVVEGMDGIPVERQWTISWSRKYGPPAPSTVRTFAALYQIWKEAGFESRVVGFDVAELVERSGGNTRKQIETDLNILFNTSIRYKNGGIGLFESIAISSKNKGSMTASPALHYTVQNAPFLLEMLNCDERGQN